MTTGKLLGVLALAAWVGFAVGCGGGSDGSSAAPVVNAAVGGIWTGTDSTGLTIDGLIDQSGQLEFIRADGTQFTGTVTATGDSISGEIQGYAAFGTQFQDGSTQGAGTFSGTIIPGSIITSTIQFTTAAGSSSTDTATLTFNSLYNSGSSLAAIAGSYTDQGTGDSVNVSNSGQVNWLDPSTGCVGSGTVSIINSAYDVYGGQFEYSDCTGAAAVLNGIPFSGLATLDTDVNPEQAVIGVTGQGIALTFSLNKM